MQLNKAAYFNGDKFIFRLGRREKDIRLDPAKYANIPLKNMITRQKEAVRETQLITWKKDLAVDWRLVVGLGGASVYDTSLTLHHIYGVPYLPASAVKGVTRNMVIAEHFNNIEGNKSSGALGDPVFCLIFGSLENSILGARQGLVRFFDAFPVSAPILCLDVMNPHYGPYYSYKNNKTPPADYHNPIPVTFLTVEEISFTICAGIKPEDNVPVDNGMFTGKTLIEIAAEWIEKALKEHGIGAKTAVGYGYFNG
ncbi:MAG: hypothetical protein A4E56_03342 [Pelotomaculum sp. PtaU1.Bin065]|nr:MAG: hypothetical protein A4E56_03342 [Pelotomaculum sp. PtaU1.Bin065]